MSENGLILLCGVAGSGKSTYRAFIERTMRNVVVLSSDELRAIIGKDENDQSVSGIVFATMRTMTKYLLKKGFNVVIDATNLTIKTRNDFLDIARAVGVETEAAVFDVTLEECLARNAKRSRKVPEDIIRSMHAKFVHPIKGEVDKVTYIDTNPLYVKNS